MSLAFFKKNNLENFIINNDSVKNDLTKVKIVDDSLILKYYVNTTLLNNTSVDELTIVIKNERFKIDRAKNIKKDLQNSKRKNYTKNKKKIRAYLDFKKSFIEAKNNFLNKRFSKKISINEFKNNNLSSIPSFVKKINNTKKTAKQNLSAEMQKASESTTSAEFKNKKYTSGKKNLIDKPVRNNFKVKYTEVTASKSLFIERDEQTNIKQVNIKIPLADISLKVDIGLSFYIDLISNNSIFCTYASPENLLNEVTNRQVSLGSQQNQPIPRFDAEDSIYAGSFVNKKNFLFLRIINNSEVERKFFAIIKPVLYDSKSSTKHMEKTIATNVAAYNYFDIDITNFFNSLVSLESTIFLVHNGELVNNNIKVWSNTPNRSERKEKVVLIPNFENNNIAFLVKNISPYIAKGRLLRKNISKGDVNYLPITSFKNMNIDQVFSDNDSNLVLNDDYEYKIEMFDFRNAIIDSQNFNYTHKRKYTYFEYFVELLSYDNFQEIAEYSFLISNNYFVNETLTTLERLAIGSNYLCKSVIDKIRIDIEENSEIYKYFNFYADFSFTSIRTGIKISKKIFIVNRSSGTLKIEVPNQDNYHVEILLRPVIKNNYLISAGFAIQNDNPYSIAFKKLFHNTQIPQISTLNTISDFEEIKIYNTSIVILDRKYSANRMFKHYCKLMFSLNIDPNNPIDFLKIYICHEETGKIFYYGNATIVLYSENTPLETANIQYYLDFSSYLFETVTFKCQPVYENNTEGSILDITSISSNSRVFLY